MFNRVVNSAVVSVSVVSAIIMFFGVVSMRVLIIMGGILAGC